MNANNFFSEAERLDVRIRLPEGEISNSHNLSNEALFQLPLLSMAILALAKSQSKPCLPEIGQLIGECLERTVAGFKGSSQDIGWSANLRIRTIKALTFLEETGLVDVDVRTKEIAATKLGHSVYRRAISADNLLSASIKVVEMSYENIRAELRIEREVP
jgi:hypothetical protein